MFSTLGYLHAILQLSNKQISVAMLFSALIITNDCSYNHIEKEQTHQDILKVSWTRSDSPSWNSACKYVAGFFLIND